MWPSSQVAESSAAQVWGVMTSDALRAKQNAAGIRQQAEAGTLTPVMLRRMIPAFRAARTYLNQNDSAVGLQQYARLVSGNATFDLATEVAALVAAYAAVVQEGRSLHNASIGSLAADGSVTEPLDTIPAASCAALIAACAAMEAAVS